MIETPNAKSIISSYEKRRLDNKRLADERKDAIYAEIPEIAELAQTSRLAYIRAARLRLSNEAEDVEESSAIQKENRERSKKIKELLVAHGYSEDYLEPIYTCPICQDTGSVDGTRCKCFLDQIVDSLYLQSNLKNVLEKENFNTFSLDYYSKEIPSGRDISPYENVCNIVERSKKFVQDFDNIIAETNEETKNASYPGNILIYGETGLGKTFISNCIAKELLDNNHSVLYLSSNELFDSILGEYLINHKTDLEDLYKYIYNSELLIIDDLGTELSNNFVLSQLFEVINKRDIAKKSTLISTNLGMRELRDRYSERIMSRIVANYTVFNFYGANIRYQKRKQEINANT